MPLYLVRRDRLLISKTSVTATNAHEALQKAQQQNELDSHVEDNWTVERQREEN